MYLLVCFCTPVWAGWIHKGSVAHIMDDFLELEKVTTSGRDLEDAGACSPAKDEGAPAPAPLGAAEDKAQLLLLLKRALKNPDASSHIQIRALHKNFLALLAKDKQRSLEAFVRRGHKPHHFQFTEDEVARSFQVLHAGYERRRTVDEVDEGVLMEENLNHRCRLMKKMQAIVDDTRVYPSMQLLRDMKEEWAQYSPVPADRQKQLQGAFFSLTRQFHKKRKLFMEAEAVNRERNFEEKTALCKKLEELLNREASLQTHRAFGTLCRAYQKIGRVPEEKRESLHDTYTHWVGALEDRLAVFAHEREARSEASLSERRDLLEKMQASASFHSDRIDDWLRETQEVRQLKEAWQALRVSEHSPETRALVKSFWRHFKQYMKSRRAFFKAIEAERFENLERKKQLIEATVQLRTRQDWPAALAAFRKIHEEWKSITLLPSKEWHAINLAFKEAMDALFAGAEGAKAEDRARRTASFKEQYAPILGLAERLADGKGVAAEQIEKAFALPALPSGDAADETERHLAKEWLHPALAACHKEIRAMGEASLLADFRGRVIRFLRARKLNLPPFLLRDEATARKKMRTLENDILLWKQNVQLFSPSASSQKFRAEVEEKIRKAECELEKLKMSLGG